MNRNKRVHLLGTLLEKYNYSLVIVVIGAAIALFFYFLPANFISYSIDDEKQIYYADNITEAHKRLIDMFNAEHEGEIEIVPVDLPFTKFNTNERKELLARTLRNPNNCIDIFAVDQIWMPRFAKWSEPLTPYFTQRERNEILNYALASCMFKNTLVGVPLHIDIGCLFYRKDLLAELEPADGRKWVQKIQRGLTWTEVAQLRDLLGSEPTFLFQADNYEGLMVNLLEAVGRDQSGVIVDGVVQMNHPRVVESIKLLSYLVYAYKVSPPAVFHFNEQATYQFALTYDTPLFRGWPTFLKECEELEGGLEKKHLYGVAPLPCREGDEPSVMLGGWNLMISKDSDKKQQAAAFLKFILSERAQKILMETSGFLPVRTIFYQNEELQQFSRLFKYGVYRPAHEQYTQMSHIISDYVHCALLKEMTIETACKQAQEALQNELF